MILTNTWCWVLNSILNYQIKMKTTAEIKASSVFTVLLILLGTKTKHSSIHHIHFEPSELFVDKEKSGG